MSNDYFNPSGTPAQGSGVDSSPVRAELLAIGAGFNKLPGLTGNDYKVVYVNASGSALDAIGGNGLLKLSSSGVPTIAVAGTDYIADIAATTHAASSKATPVDADEVGLVDSAASNALKKLTWANIKATLKTYFDPIYAAIAGFQLTGALLFKSGLNNIASAATLNLTAIGANSAHVTGATGISALTMTSGQVVDLIFDGVLTLTHHATNNNLPGGANITTAAGDRARYWYDGTAVWCVGYNKADGTAVASGASGAFATGMGMALHGATVPSGWILADGRTIGDGSSGATNRANADCQALFTEFWNSMTDTEAPVSGGRGASAAADWAAHKTIQVPDGRGRVVAGKDNMGGTTASRLTNGGSGITGTTLGTAGGTETHTLTTAQLASHTHTVWGRGAGTGSATSFVNTSSVVTDGDINMQTIGAGSGNAHQNTQPTLIANWIIKL